MENYPGFNPLHQYKFSPYCSLCISYGADKEDLFNNQGPLQLAIIFLYSHDLDV